MSNQQTVNSGCQSPSDSSGTGLCGLEESGLEGIKCEFLQNPEAVSFLKNMMNYPDAIPIENGIYNDISPEEAYALIMQNQNNRNFTVLDVRSSNEFNQSRVPGSTRLDFFSPSFKKNLSNLDRNGTYVVYCKMGVRSKLAMKLMEKMGFREVYNVVGGEERWIIEEIPYGYPQNPDIWSDMTN